MSNYKKLRNALIVAGGLAAMYYTGGAFGPEEVREVFDSVVERVTNALSE